eukprot:TRINITY_DN4442_c0_g1_i3.p1 TRINITY_DN4442_c0_g1~~TRINITY_DN4442_c0_g1_i3.p1  ORF type:complete len:121 (-),score=30.36 TRINITY_DN4442_c0_g1_i3:160-522(-)
MSNCINKIMDQQAKSNKLTMKQVEELRAMFTCYSKDDMMTQEQLNTMFANINFVPTQSQKEKYAKLFAIRDKISCNEFMTIFKIKADDIPYSKSEILNAFKVNFPLKCSFYRRSIRSRTI